MVLWPIRARVLFELFYKKQCRCKGHLEQPWRKRHFFNENDVAISKYNSMPMLCFYNL